ncbi:MAG: NADH:flavin oxidoreductase, partial [Proteobacteria bacterium]|nr:NADH:flavin oxidoreductase [Pseudomonadota bacterium]
MKDPLFEPILIHGLQVKNRIYMPPMHLNMCPTGEVTDQLTAFYAERAAGGAGLISVGYATVNDMAGQFACLGAHEDRFVPGLTRLAGAIKTHGARAVVQINHAGRQTHSMMIEGRQPVAPSAVPSPLTKETPRPLDRKEIPGIVEDYARAALRVQQAGFDGVEVITGTGYLISQFLSPNSNQRADEYGGSFENRMRFGLEIMRAIKKTTGEDFPLIARLNGNEFMPGGNGRRELQAWARALVGAGVDALSINQGWHEARVPLIVSEVPRGTYGYLARGIKEQVGVPVVASHRINDPDTAREMISDGLCDMTAMGRGLIA